MSVDALHHFTVMAKANGSNIYTSWLILITANGDTLMQSVPLPPLPQFPCITIKHKLQNSDS